MFIRLKYIITVCVIIIFVIIACIWSQIKIAISNILNIDIKAQEYIKYKWLYV